MTLNEVKISQCNTERSTVCKREKIAELGIIKVENCSSKHTVENGKTSNRQGKTFSGYRSDKELDTGIYKELSELNIGKQK